MPTSSPSLRDLEQYAQHAPVNEREPYDDDSPLEPDDEREDNPDGDDEDRDDNPGQLEGLLIGPPFATALDCDLLDRDDKRKVPGCCACLKCDACGQQFRINLLSASGFHACPKCKLEYTSVLIVATADDHTILQHALETVLRSNGIAINPDGDDDEAGDDDDDSAAEPK